jgi:ATP-dependent RNA helicase DHX8/PRP22
LFPFLACPSLLPSPAFPFRHQVHVDEPAGDILVFLTGQEEIDSLARLLEERSAALPEGGAGGLGLAVLPIYAALPPEQQVKVRRGGGGGHTAARLLTAVSRNMPAAATAAS